MEGRSHTRLVWQSHRSGDDQLGPDLTYLSVTQVSKRSFAEVATFGQRLFISLADPDLRLFWPAKAVTAP